LLITGFVTVGLIFLDYLIPAWWTKKYWGSSRGTTGAIVWTIMWFFVIPWVWIIIWPFIGALIGELLHGKKTNQALKAARWSLVWFIAGTGIRVTVAIIFTVIFVSKLMV
jgi:uncharacterized protein YqgC (DUF456 family)